MKEDQYLTAGKGASVFRSPLGVTGAGICFDLRFPDHFSKMSDSGSEIFLLPAHWPLLRIDHWDVLLRARAIENQAYMIETNSTVLAMASFWRHSAVNCPRWRGLLQASRQCGFVIRYHDLEMVSEILLFPLERIRSPVTYLINSLGDRLYGFLGLTAEIKQILAH
jgi:predicted amidohydrolase